MREIDNDLLHESLFKNQPLLKFDEKADFQAWRKAVKEKFLELLGMELNKRHKNLIVFLEIDRCMSDAVQFLVGQC